MTTLQQRLQMLGKRILENAVPLKLAVGAILGIVTGPGLLGFLSEYATYRYSLYYGLRPPLEGIPYLRAAVTLGSFVLGSNSVCSVSLVREKDRCFISYSILPDSIRDFCCCYKLGE